MVVVGAGMAVFFAIFLSFILYLPGCGRQLDIQRLKYCPKGPLKQPTFLVLPSNPFLSYKSEYKN